MKLTLLVCLFLSSISALGAPISHSSSRTTTTASASSPVHDEPITRVVTVTVTRTAAPSNTPPASAPPLETPSPTLTDPASTTSSQPPPEPTPSQALLNAQQAQKLNATFRDIRLADQCTTGTKACVEGGLMTCNQGRWVGAHCPGSQQCFAVPIDSLTDAGTNLACMSEKTAASLIEKAGATGGAFGPQ